MVIGLDSSSLEQTCMRRYKIKRSSQFQRIGSCIAATMQYNNYDPLRIKTNSTTFSQIHPFEDKCNSVQLNFPKLELTVDSTQYNAVYQVATDLLLYKEPAKKERLVRLREIMMAADRSSLHEASKKIVDLQKSITITATCSRSVSSELRALG
jgi:hypothetical protein